MQQDDEIIERGDFLPSDLKGDNLGDCDSGDLTIYNDPTSLSTEELHGEGEGTQESNPK